jgi:predicted nucleic acid-binding protein
VTIIADTSPIHYAVLIGVEEAIFSLYGGIVIPAAVYAELTDAGAPAGLRRWLEQSLDRIEIRHVILPDDPRLQTLDAGEAEAIFLAEQTPDALLLIDEKDGRTEARPAGSRSPVSWE